jgi:hypothetical protein
VFLFFILILLWLAVKTACEQAGGDEEDEEGQPSEGVKGKQGAGGYALFVSGILCHNKLIEGGYKVRPVFSDHQCRDDRFCC